QARYPDLVVTAGEIFRWRQALTRCAGLIEIPQAGAAHRQRQRKRAALPCFVKSRLVGLGRDRSEILHAAHVVHAVHARSASSRTGGWGRPIPIMESRVTSAAS